MAADPDLQLQIAGFIDTAHRLGVEARTMLDVTDPAAEDYLAGCLSRIAAIIEELETQRVEMERALHPAPPSP